MEFFSVREYLFVSIQVERVPISYFKWKLRETFYVLCLSTDIVSTVKDAGIENITHILSFIS